MTFLQWLDKYFNSTLTLSQQAQETGLSESQILEWVRWSQQKGYEHALREGQIITKDDLAAMWTAEHPPVIEIQTPFGKTSQPVNAYFGPLLEEIDKLLTKHLGQ